MKWVDGLRRWRKDRNIVAPQGAYILSMQEELTEYEDAQTEHDRIDALADALVFTCNEIELEGYNIDLVMKQVVKHISARKQDPIQAEAWFLNGPSGKWQKDMNQDPSTLHEPDYSLCKLPPVNL